MSIKVPVTKEAHVNQCFVSGSAWIRIIGGLLDTDPGSYENKTKIAATNTVTTVNVKIKFKH